MTFTARGNGIAISFLAEDVVGTLLEFQKMADQINAAPEERKVVLMAAKKLLMESQNGLFIQDGTQDDLVIRTLDAFKKRYLLAQ